MPVAPRESKLPWKPWPEAGEDAVRLDRLDFDPKRVVSATVKRNADNRWEWAVWVGGRLIGKGDHHRPGRAFTEASTGWIIGTLLIERLGLERRAA